MGRRILRVVVRRVDNLGDIIIALPVLKALRVNYRGAKLSLMVKEAHQVLCKDLADEFIAPIPLDRFAELTPQFDLAFNIDYFGPGNAAKQTLRRGEVNHVNAIWAGRRRTMSGHLLAGLVAYGLQVPRGSDPRYRVPSALKLEVRKWLEQADLTDKHELWVGIHIGSRVPHKRWSSEKFIRLSMWLHRSLGAHLFFIGAAEDERAIQMIRAALPIRATEALVGYPLDFVAGMLSRMDFVIGNDSGIGHLSAAVRTPTVSIFGPTSPVLWRPSGTRSVFVTRRSGPRYDDSSGPLLSVSEVKQGVLFCIQRHVERSAFPPLDQLRLSRTVRADRTPKGVVVRSGARGSACLVDGGWQRVKQILRSVKNHNSFETTLQSFPDSGPVLNLFILHGIILQGRIGNR